MQLKRLTSALSSLLFIAQGTALAAEPVFNPDTVAAGLVGKNIANSPYPFTPKPISGAAPPASEPAAINPEMYKVFFVLNKITLSGNHAFSTEELQKIFAPYIHKRISVAQLQKLVQEVTDKYQKAGYLLSKALLEPQEIANGAVKVTVIEGFISEIKVQGLKRKSLIRFVEKYGDRIKASKPIKLADLERTLLLINDVSGFTVKSVLAPDPNVPLGSTLTLLTEVQTVEAKATQDNYQTLYLGPDETSLYASLNSFITPGGSLYAHVMNTDQHSNLQYYELRYDQVLGTNGTSFSVDSYVTRTHPQFILAPLDVFGSSNDVNATLSYPLIRSRQRSLYILGQFDYMNNDSDALGEQLYSDRIRDASFTAQYTDLAWNGEDNLSLTFDKGFNILGVDNNRGFRSRLGARSDFFKMMGTASRNQFIGSKFSLYGLVTAQYSNAILPAADTFIFGGPFLGRGYDWAQFTGDQGVAGKVELRLNTNPDYRFLKQIQYYIFCDSGKLWSLIPDVPETSGTSAGLGFRAMIVNHLNVEAFVGKALTTPNATEVLLGNSGHAALGFFQVTAYL